jgi:alpha-tubulin suppressor-like RCC1 family protein
MSCGSGQYGQLGVGGQLDTRYVPVLIQGLKDIKQIASGHYHCMALAKDGSLFSWGSGSWGKLGLSFDGNINMPRQVATLMSSVVEMVIIPLSMLRFRAGTKVSKFCVDRWLADRTTQRV